MSGLTFRGPRFQRLAPTADTAQSRPERPMHACLDSIVRIARRRRRLLLRRLRVPQIDMQTLDLFDQQQNRFSGRAKIVIAIGMKTRAPGAKLLDLALVQPIAQGRPPPRSLVANPTRETHTQFRCAACGVVKA